MKCILFFIFFNILIYAAAFYFQMERIIFNLDYLIPFFLVYFRYQKIAIISLCFFYIIDVLILIRQIFPFFKIDDIIYILKFVFLSSSYYQLCLIILICVLVVFSCLLYNLKKSSKYFLYFFILISNFFIFQNFVINEKNKYISSQFVSFLEIRFDGFVQSFDIPQYYLKEIEPTVATAELIQNKNKYMQKNENILFIVSESLGAPNNKEILDYLLFPLQKLNGVSNFRVDHVEYNMPTMYAEFRELCAITLESFNLNTVNHNFDNCLPNIFRKNGYQTTAFHASLGIMYDRKDWYPKVGFNQVQFYEHKNWTRRCYSFSGGCDFELVSDVVSILKKEKQFVYWLTLNSHAPYDSRDIIKDLFPCTKFNIKSDTEVCRNLKIHAQFFNTLADSLSRENFKPTEVIIVGDHTPTIFNLEDKEKYFNGDGVLVIKFQINY